MTVEIHLPDNLDIKLNQLIEAGVFKSREEAILQGAEQLMERLEQNKPVQAEDSFSKNQAYFENHKLALQNQYQDAFVAVWNEQIVDHDGNRTRLAKRIYEKFGSVPVYIDQPSVSPARFLIGTC